MSLPQSVYYEAKIRKGDSYKFNSMCDFKTFDYFLETFEEQNLSSK